MLHAVTQGNSRIRRKGQEGGIYTVQKLWLKCHGYASQTTYTLCATLKTEFFRVLRHSKLECLTVLLFLAFGKRNM